MKASICNLSRRTWTIWGTALCLSIAAFAVSGCSGSGTLQGPLVVIGDHVAVSNYPLAYFVERLGGGEIEVKFAAPSDVDPSFWKPDEAAISDMQSALLILINGATYEKWLSTATLPEERVVSTADGFKPQWIRIENAITHSHGPGEEHSHAGTATHTWLNPQLALKQSEAVARELKTAYPDLADSIEKNLAALKVDLETLDQRIEGELAGLNQQALVASHPVYEYLGDRLQANLESVVWEPNSTPSDKEMQDFAELLKDHQATIMLWEGEPTPETKSQLEQLGVSIVVYETCGNRPEKGDWLTAMQANIDRLAAATKTKSELE